MYEIPRTTLLLILIVGLIVLAILNIDSWTHATIGLIVGYLLKHETLQSVNN